MSSFFGRLSFAASKEKDPPAAVSSTPPSTTNEGRVDRSNDAPPSSSVTDESDDEFLYGDGDEASDKHRSGLSSSSAPPPPPPASIISLSRLLFTNQLKVNLRIENTEKTVDNSGPLGSRKSYVRYMIDVNIIAANVSSSSVYLNWRIGRRFREFEELYEKLKSYKSSTGKSSYIPPLPKKSLKRSFDPEYILSKKLKLQEWLNDFTLDAELFSCPPFLTFLLSEPEEIWKKFIELAIAKKKQTLTPSQNTTQPALSPSSSSSIPSSTSSSIPPSSTANDIPSNAHSTNAPSPNTIDGSTETSKLKELNDEWIDRSTALINRFRSLKTEKNDAIRVVHELGEQIKKLRSEKKVLIHAVKQLQKSGTVSNSANNTQTQSDEKKETDDQTTIDPPTTDNISSSTDPEEEEEEVRNMQTIIRKQSLLSSSAADSISERVDDDDIEPALESSDASLP